MTQIGFFDEVKTVKVVKTVNGGGGSSATRSRSRRSNSQKRPSPSPTPRLTGTGSIADHGGRPSRSGRLRKRGTKPTRASGSCSPRATARSTGLTTRNGSVC